MKRDYRLDKDFPLHITRWVPSVRMTPLHWHDSFEVGYCLSGTGQFYFGEKRYRVNAGDVFVVGSMEKHRAQSDPEDPSTFLFVKFDPSLIGGAEHELLVPFIAKPKHFVNRIDRENATAVRIGELVRLIWEETEERGNAYRSMVKGALTMVCTLLFRYYSQEMSPQEWHRALQAYKKLEPALRLIHERFHEDIQLRDIAECLSLSESRTYHLFKETMGEGFKKYLTRIRIRDAIRKLGDPNASITEIYLSCGFQGHAAFYRAFRQVVGMTPKAYSSHIIS